MRSMVDALFLDDELRSLRASVRGWVERTLRPHVDAWEDAASFPREIYRDAAHAGILGVGFPEAAGGSGGDLRHMLIVAEELTRSGSPGLAASLGSLVIALPPILAAGTPEQVDRFVRPVLRGECIAALAVTEPSGGSDVANLRTRAIRVEGGYRVTGSKTFITSGTRADLFTVAVRTGGEGAGGVSALVIERDTAGFTIGPNLAKLGWHASDTAELHWDDCFVPDANLLGGENAGFGVLMQNFAAERLILAATGRSRRVSCGGSSRSATSRWPRTPQPTWPVPSSTGACSFTAAWATCGGR